MEKGPDKETGKRKSVKSKSMKFVRQFQKDYIPDKGEYNDGKSNTVPDMSLSVKQLLRNHTRGIYSDVKHYEPHFFDTEIPHFDDITEKIEYMESLKEQEKEIIEKVKEENKAKIEARKLKKAEKAEKDKELKKQSEIIVKTNSEATNEQRE